MSDHVNHRLVQIPESLHRYMRDDVYIKNASVVIRQLIEKYAAGEVSLPRSRERLVSTSVRVDSEVYEKAAKRAKQEGFTMKAAINDLLAQFIKEHAETVRALEELRVTRAEAQDKKAA